MSFKIKDLMITVLPKEAVEAAKLCIWGTRICIWPTLFTGWRCCSPCTIRLTCGWCSLHPTICRFGTIDPCGITDPCGGTFDPWVIRDVRDIGNLRLELKDTLKQLDELEKTGLPSVETPEADLGDLEERLKAALREVQARKAAERKKGR